MDTIQKKNFWQNHIEACGKSGLSQVEYCSAHNVPLSTFGYWKRKLSNEDNSKPVFYPLTVTPVHAGDADTKDTGLVLYLRDRCFSIEIEHGFSASTLSRVLTILEEL
jgi:hypothetical protein